MLKRIRVRNFVHFDEVQDLMFEEGPHFFIGPNESGKTCMFEAIRRCMSTSKSTGASTSHDHKQPSIILCDFELTGPPITQVISGVVRLPIEGQMKDTRNNPFIKFVMEHKNDSTPAMLHLDFVKKDPGKSAVNEKIDLNSDTKTEIVACLTSKNTPNDTLFGKLVEELDKNITEQLKEFRKKNVKYNRTTECEEYLVNHIDSSVIVTFPAKSIAPVQWTKSPRMSYSEGTQREDDRKMRKRGVPERSEIVFWYYEQIDNDEITPQEKAMEDQYFKEITDNYNYVFEKERESGELVAFENKHREKRLPLEKVPEGFLEAKNCSILLAIAGSQTICLEEAGRGMHPQMIERMRDLVLKTIKNKVVIVTSHVPSFLASWNVSRTFFFRRIHGNQAEAETTFKVVSGNNGLKKDVGRLITDQVCSVLFFARRVLFVEGETDNNFMSKLRAILLNDEALTKRLIRKCLGKEMESETFYRFMAPLHIISLNGHKNKKRFRNISIELSLEHYFLLDHDAVVDVSSEIPELKQERPPDVERSAKGFLEAFEYTYDDNEVVKDVAILEREGVFVWRKSPAEYYKKSIAGTIEGAVVSLVKETDSGEGSFKRFLETNHVHLKWNESDKKRKLFSNPNVTDDNAVEVVQNVLEHCEKRNDSDMFRFIRFLFNSAFKQETDR